MPNIQFGKNVTVKEVKTNNKDINFTSKRAKINVLSSKLVR